MPVRRRVVAPAFVPIAATAVVVSNNNKSNVIRLVNGELWYESGGVYRNGSGTVVAQRIS